MIRSVAVVGANGRVGSALARHLAGDYEVIEVTRAGTPSLDALTRRAATADLIVNAAGVAHVESATAADVERLEAGNVELLVALAARALEQRVSLVHVSSVKAMTPEESPYAASKHRGEVELRERYSAAFESAGLSLVVVRPLAMLFPPFDAGRLARLKPLRWIPRAFVPSLHLPAITAVTFLGAIDGAVTAIADGTAAHGMSQVDFGRDAHATLRDIRDAMAAGTGQP